MTDPELPSRAEVLHKRIVAANQNVDMRLTSIPPERWPWWYQDLLIKLDLIAKINEVKYVSSSLSIRMPAGGEIFALTDTLVIYAAVTDVQPGGNADTAVTVWSRSELTELRVLHVDDSSAFWTSDRTGPASLRLQLSYPGRPAVTIPLADRSGDEATQAVALTYAGLLENISQR